MAHLSANINILLAQPKSHLLSLPPEILLRIVEQTETA
jgi:hypothetical protein